ncbi:permease [bacterium]|nr:permease [bacterium]
MKNKMKEQHIKEGKKNIIWLTFAILIFLITLKIVPDKSSAVMAASWSYFKEMMILLPAIMVLMGLFMVWISKDLVLKYLGKDSGIKGMLISFVLGSLPTGPLYVAFPLVAGLKQKGASITNIVIFLSAWACIKLPQEMVELQFLGWKFMTARLVLTIIFVTIMGIGMGKLLNMQAVESIERG